MDKLSVYRSILRRVVGDYLEYLPPEKDVELIPVCDDEGGHYMLMEIGWRYPNRIYRVFFHMRLVNEKIWVEQDMTEYGIPSHLLDAGVPPEDIELGLQHPSMRPHTELADLVARKRAAQDLEKNLLSAAKQ